MNLHPRERDEIERLASTLPDAQPPSELWTRIEADIRVLQKQGSTASPSAGLFGWLNSLVRRPALRLATYALVLLAGSAMGIYLIQDYGNKPGSPVLESSKRDEILQDAREDIEQAMYYYERAIEKLSDAAKEREQELDPAFVALQQEKIRLLRESINECKTTLRVNGLHPRVQHYLLAAYSDLQSTLQDMLAQQQ